MFFRVALITQTIVLLRCLLTSGVNPRLQLQLAVVRLILKEGRILFPVRSEPRFCDGGTSLDLSTKTHLRA